MGNNIAKFASVMSDRMKQTSDAAIPTTIELGTVNADLSITSDSLQANIPVGDYMVNLMLTGEKVTAAAGGQSTETAGEQSTETEGEETEASGDHSHQLPDTLRGLQSGDRVLLAWCGNDAVVIAIVVSS